MSSGCIDGVSYIQERDERHRGHSIVVIVHVPSDNRGAFRIFKRGRKVSERGLVRGREDHLWSGVFGGLGESCFGVGDVESDGWGGECAGVFLGCDAVGLEGALVGCGLVCIGSGQI